VAGSPSTLPKTKFPDNAYAGRAAYCGTLLRGRKDALRQARYAACMAGVAEDLTSAKSEQRKVWKARSKCAPGKGD
jgi:hypothetical protein